MINSHALLRGAAGACAAVLVMAACGDDTVTQPRACPVEIAIKPSSATLAPGDTVRFSATFSCGDDTTTARAWRSSDATVATVDSEGLARGIRPGTAVITGFAVPDTTKRAAAALTVLADAAGGMRR